MTDGGEGGAGVTTGGGGGGGSFQNNAAAGGAGGIHTHSGLSGTYNTLAIEGGIGGSGAAGDGGDDSGGGGGGGGHVAANVSGAIEAATLTISGGTGGAGGSNAIVAGGVTAGAGGAGGTNGQGGGGGGGGNAVLNAAGQTVTVINNLSISSGANGSGGIRGGAGGAASFTATTLIAPNINLIKKDGALTFNVTTLDVSGGNTALNLTGTTAAGVTIGNVTLAGGNTFTLNNSAGDMTLTNLNVTGTGRLFVADGARQSITNLNAAGADLTFVLPAGVVANQTIASVNNANITGATIGVDDGNGRITMSPGQSVKLLAASGGITGQAANLTVQTLNGDIFDLQVSGNDLLLILQQISPNTPAYERLKAYAEGRTATLAFVNQGTDLIINQGMGSAIAATSGPGFQFNAFAAGSGGWNRYNTGSHVDVSGASMLAGLAIGNDAGPGRITAGLFFEGGWGNYNSYNSFSNYAPVDGAGDTNYYGGGLLGRYDLTGGAFSGLYFDASARLGNADADFSTGDIRYNGNKANFDSGSTYWGAHAGLGYQWNFSEKAMLDISGKFIWTRQNGDNISVHEDQVRFSDADSLRTRLGGCFYYALNEYATPYAGAYWEHEFDGKQHSSVNNINIAAPSLKGDTGIAELGITITPVKNSPFSMNLAVQGYAGVREGITGSLQLKFKF